MQTDINRLLELTKLTHELQRVKRHIYIVSEENQENDMEHSFQLAFIALYIVDAEQLPLDSLKAAALALVHDMVEVHAGDQLAIGRTEEAQQIKTKLEKQARVQLKQDWPEFKLLHDLIDEYEARQTPESKFVYALDKLLPIMNTYLDNGRMWQHLDATLEKITASKTGKIDKDPVINTYYMQLVELLEQKPELFS